MNAVVHTSVWSDASGNARTQTMTYGGGAVRGAASYRRYRLR
jgi:hypothetical protein